MEMTAKERMMAAKAKREEAKEKEAEKKRIAAEKRKQKAAEKAAEKKKSEEAAKKNVITPTTVPTPTSNQTVNIEIDYNEFRKLITVNQSKLDENLIYRTCFKPYYKGGKLGKRGRHEALIEAIFRVMQDNASKLVKKVTREDVI
jgi:phage protein D